MSILSTLLNGLFRSASTPRFLSAHKKTQLVRHDLIFLHQWIITANHTVIAAVAVAAGTEADQCCPDQTEQHGKHPAPEVMQRCQVSEDAVCAASLRSVSHSQAFLFPYQTHGAYQIHKKPAKRLKTGIQPLCNIVHELAQKRNKHRIADQCDLVYRQHSFQHYADPGNHGKAVTDADFFKVADAYGKCEVILYSPEHTVTLPELSVEHIEKLVDLWIERFVEIKKDEKIKYVFIFENRGEVVGVTMPHPHGQIYGYSFVPKKLQLEVESAKEFKAEKDKCIFCEMLEQEQKAGSRVIFETEHFTVFLPFFCEYPYGVYIMSKRHLQNIAEFTAEEKADFAKVMKETTGMLDSLFDYKFPYMMCMHNAPVNGEDTSEYFHFHVEFFPPMRSAEKQKFNASSETGAWAHCNPTAPEEKAKELREAHKKFVENNM